VSWWSDLQEYWELYVVEALRGMQLPPVSLWVGLVFVAVLVWVLRRSRTGYERMTALEAAPAGFVPDATVVIPARNEEANIADAVKCFADSRVIVVDDGSKDETALLAAAAGATVIPAPAMKKGQKGKPNACWAGAQLVETPWILFVDADTRYQPGTLAALVHFAEANNMDCVSMFLKQEMLTFWERLLVPYAFALYFCGVDSKRVNRTKTSHTLVNGQCMLVRRESYEYVGGHGAVAESVIEDVALARAFKHQRKHLRVLQGAQFGSSRTYDGFRSILRGVQKNSFRFLLLSPNIGFRVVTSSLLLTAWLPMVAWLVLQGQWMVAALVAATPPVFLYRWYRNIRDVLLTPLTVYVFQLLAIAGMYHTSFGRKTLWKGRKV